MRLGIYKKQKATLPSKEVKGDYKSVLQGGLKAQEIWKNPADVGYKSCFLLFLAL